MRYAVYLTASETRYIEVEANDKDEAEMLALERADESEPYGDESVEVEIEEIE